MVVIVLLCVAYASSTQLHLLDRTYWNVQEYRMSGGDFERIRGETYSKINLSDFRGSLSEEDTLLVLDNRPDDYVMLRYQAYPIKVLGVDSLPEYISSQWFLCLTDTYHTIIPAGFDYSSRLRPDVMLYGKTEIRSKPYKEQNKHWSYYMAVTLIYILFTWITGRWVVILCLSELEDSNRLPWIAFPVGFVVVNLVTMLYAIYCNSKPSQMEYIFLVGACTAPALFYWRRLFIGIFRFRKVKDVDLVSATLYGLSIVSLSLIVFQLLIAPMLTGDAVAHWMLKSKIIFHQGYDFSFGNRMEYPIFWSNYAGVAYHLAGAAYDQMSKWIQVVVVLSYVGILMTIARELRLSHLATGLLLFGSFAMSQSFFFAAMYAETIHTLFILLIVQQGLHYANSGKLSLLLLVVGFVGVVMTKIEGIPQGAILAAGIGSMICYRRGLFTIDGLKPMAAFAVSLLVYGLWIAFSKQFIDIGAVETLQVRNEPMSLFKIYKWAKVTCNNMSQTDSSIGMLIGMAMILTLINRAWDIRLYFVLYTGILMLAFSQAAILGWKLEKILTDSTHATPRLFSHAMPFVVIFAAMLTDRVKDSFGSRFQ
jgi:hypothetical protein